MPLLSPPPPRPGKQLGNSYPTTGWFSLYLPLICCTYWVQTGGVGGEGMVKKSNSLLITGNMRKLSLPRLLRGPYPTCSSRPAADYDELRKSRWAGVTFNQSVEQVAGELPNSKSPEKKKYCPYMPCPWKMGQNTGKHYGPKYYVSVDAIL